MLRTVDFVLAAFGLVLGVPVFLLILLVGFFDSGFPLFFQTRVGRGQRPFTLVKFRTMRVNTASVPTHLVDVSATTRMGRFLRRTKLDELPQLWNVLAGDMSLVGPRPCLPNQTELIEERSKRRVFEARPGITGLAQVRGIDMSTPEFLAETDAQMLRSLTFGAYCTYILLTLSGKGAGDRIKSNLKNGAGNF